MFFSSCHSISLFPGLAKHLESYVGSVWTNVAHLRPWHPVLSAQAGFITTSLPDWPFSKALPSSCLPGCHMLLSIPSQAAPLAGSLCTYGLHSLRTYSPNSSLLSSAHHLFPFCGCKFHYHTSDAKGLSPAYPTSQLHTHDSPLDIVTCMSDRPLKLNKSQAAPLIASLPGLLFLLSPSQKWLWG